MESFRPTKTEKLIAFYFCKIHPFINLRSNDDIVYWEAIICGHFLLLRTGEFMLCNKEHFDPLHNLTLGNVTSHQSLGGQHYWKVHVKQSKTDQQCQGVTLYMSHAHHSVCPGWAMESNLSSCCSSCQRIIRSGPTASNIHVSLAATHWCRSYSL